MAQETVITAKVDASSGIKTIKDLRNEVSKYRDQLAGLEQGTQEYNKVLANLADVQGKITNINNDVRASTMNLAQTFSSVTGSLSGIAGGFTAVQGVLALTGSNAEALEQTFVKLQAALALTQGLTAFTNGIRAANAAFKALSITLTKIPLLGVIAGITAITAGLVAWYRQVKQNNDIQKQFNETLKTYNETLSGLQYYQDQAIQYAEAEGKGQDEIIKLRVAHTVALRDEAQAALEEINALGKLTDEQKKQRDELREQVKAFDLSISNLFLQANLYQIRTNREKNEAIKKQNEAAYKARLEAQKKFNQDLVYSIEDEFNRLERVRTDAIKQVVTDYADLQEAIRLLNEEFADERNPIALLEGFSQWSSNEAIEQRRLAYQEEIYSLQALTENTLLSLEQRANAYTLLQTKIAAYTAFNTKATAAEKKNNEDLLKDRLRAFNAYADILSSSQAILGQSTVAGKALGVASATISTYVGAAQVLANPTELNPYVKWAQFAATIATGLVAVKNILSTDVPGAGTVTSGETSSPALPTIPELQSPIQETYTSVTSFDEDAINAIPRSVLVVEDFNSVQQGLGVAVKESTF